MRDERQETEKGSRQKEETDRKTERDQRSETKNGDKRARWRETRN